MSTDIDAAVRELRETEKTMPDGWIYYCQLCVRHMPAILAELERVTKQRDAAVATAKSLHEHMGGHSHWDAQGNNGRTCPTCEYQRIATDVYYRFRNSNPDLFAKEASEKPSAKTQRACNNLVCQLTGSHTYQCEQDHQEASDGK